MPSTLGDTWPHESPPGTHDASSPGRDTADRHNRWCDGQHGTGPKGIPLTARTPREEIRYDYEKDTNLSDAAIAGSKRR